MTMRRTTMRLVALATVVAGGWGACALSFGQEDDGAEAAARAHALYDQGRFAEAVEAYTTLLKLDPNDSDIVESRGSASDAIQIAAKAYRDAEGDDAKAEAKTKLVELLNKYFDEDMARRKAEVAKIEERLTKLRAMLERRVAKKQEIIDLQTKVVVNEADGLGFFEASSPNPAANPQLWATPYGGPPRPALAYPALAAPPASDADPFAAPTPAPATTSP